MATLEVEDMRVGQVTADTFECILRIVAEEGETFLQQPRFIGGLNEFRDDYFAVQSVAVGSTPGISTETLDAIEVTDLERLGTSGGNQYRMRVTMRYPLFSSADRIDKNPELSGGVRFFVGERLLHSEIMPFPNFSDTLTSNGVVISDAEGYSAEEVYFDNEGELIRIPDILYLSHLYGDDVRTKGYFVPEASRLELDSLSPSINIPHKGRIIYCSQEFINGKTNLEKQTVEQYKDRVYKTFVEGFGLYADHSKQHVGTEILENVKISECVERLLEEAGFNVNDIDVEETDGDHIVLWHASDKDDMKTSLLKLLNISGPNARIDDYEGTVKFTVSPQTDTVPIFGGKSYATATDDDGNTIPPEELITFQTYRIRTDENRFWNAVRFTTARYETGDAIEVLNDATGVTLAAGVSIDIKIDAPTDQLLKSPTATMSPASGYTAEFTKDSGDTLILHLENTSTSSISITNIVVMAEPIESISEIIVESKDEESIANIGEIPWEPVGGIAVGASQAYLETLADTLLERGVRGSQVIELKILSSNSINEARHERVLALRPGVPVTIQFRDPLDNSAFSNYTGTIKHIKRDINFQRSDISTFTVSCDLVIPDVVDDVFTLNIDRLSDGKVYG